MPMTLRGKHNAVKVARCGVLSAVALIFSYLESLIPISIVIPLPGFKLGLANVLISVVLFEFSVPEAFIISSVKVIVSSFLFGSPMSFAFSAAGAALSLAGLTLIKYTLADKFSYIGISVIGASLHNTGQIIAAMIFFGWQVINYLPVLLICSVVFGILCGSLICLTEPRIKTYFQRRIS